jgi:hypothetical protein
MSNIFQTALSNIVATFQKPRRTKAIRLYAQRLGRLLQAKYGEQETYTPAQVKTTMKEWGYPIKYSCYGLAMYCDLIDFNDYHRSIGESCDYEVMRGEISNCLFSNESTTFSGSSLVESNFNFDFNEYHQHHTAGGHHSADSGNYDGGGHCASADAGGGSYDGGGYYGGGDSGSGGY